MRTYIRLIQILIIAALVVLWEFSYATNCSVLFNNNDILRDKQILETNGALRMIQLIAHAEIESYQISENKSLVVIYDKSRSHIVKKSDRITKIVTEDGIKQKAYPYTRDQTQALSDNLQTLARHAMVAIVDPYSVNPAARNTNSYGLFEAAKKSLAGNHHLRKLSDARIDASTEHIGDRYADVMNKGKTGLFIGFGATMLAISQNDANIGVPMLVAGLGLSFHTMFSTGVKLGRVHLEEHARLSQELADRILKESDTELNILILPETARPTIEPYFDKKFLQDN